MKKIILIITLIMSCWSFSQEQKLNNTETNDVKVKIITIDYVTKSFEDGIISSHLKVGDWVQFRVINVPSNLKYEGNLSYTNRNLELRNSFGGYLTFDKNNPFISGNNLENSDNASEKNKENDKDLDSIKDKTLKEESSEKNQEIFKERNVNLETMIKDLEINIAKKYLEKSGTHAKKALDDINWQKILIKLLYKNVNDKIRYKDNEIEKLSKKIDSLNSKIVSQDETIYFPPIKLENYDFTQFSFILNDKDKISKLNIPFSNYKGFKLDFSTGFVFNGLQTQNYKLLALDTDNVVIREEENGLSFNTGIALLAHAYQRSRNVANYAITTGLSFNLNNQNLNYILGGSILLGDDQRFIFSAGVTAGKVKELVRYYNVDEAISNTILLPSAEVPVVEKLKASWFFSITYNLGIGEPSKTIKL